MILMIDEGASRKELLQKGKLFSPPIKDCTQKEAPPSHTFGPRVLRMSSRTSPKLKSAKTWSPTRRHSGIARAEAEEERYSSWVTENSRLADKRHLELIQANFKKLLRKQTYHIEASEADREANEEKTKFNQSEKVRKKKLARQEEHERFLNRVLSPGEVLESLPKIEQDKLANYAGLDPGHKEFNEYVEKCTRVGTVVPCAEIMGLEMKVRGQGVYRNSYWGKMDIHHRFQHEFVLDLTGKNHHAQSIKFLTPMLHHKKQITILKLSDNPLKGSGAKLLFTNLHESCPNLEELHLTKCGIGTQGGKALCSYLKNATSLKKIYVRSNALREQFCASFSDAMCNTQCALAEIDLGDNSLTPKAGLLLNKGIQRRGKSLMVFLADWNRLGDEGVGAIAESFPTTSLIGKVNFSYNNLTDKISKGLPDLALRPQMSTFDASHNQLGPIFANRLRENITGAKSSLVYLDIGYNPLGTFETAHIVECIKNNKVRTLKITNTTDISGGDEDKQYVFELATRVARAKGVLFMLKRGRKKKIVVEIEWPPKKRVQRSKLIKSMMGWMKKKRKHKGVTEWSGGENNLVNLGEGWHSLHIADDVPDKPKPVKKEIKYYSVFHDRIKNCDSHSYWDSQQVNGMAFEEDWCVLDHTRIVKPRMSKPEERKVHDLLKENYILLREIFMFYAATGNKQMKKELSVSMYGMRDFVADSKIVSKKYSTNDVDMTFLAAAMDNKADNNDFIKQQKKEYYNRKVKHVTKTDDHHLNILRVSQHMKMQKEIFAEHVKDFAEIEDHDQAVQELLKLQALNHEKAKGTKEDGKAVNIGAQTLTRTEFLEFIFRLSMDRYLKTKQAQSPSEAITMMLDNHIIPNAFSDIVDYDRSMFFDRNRFRDEKLYFKEVDQAFRDYFMELQAIYGYYSLGEHFAFEGKLVELEELDMVEFWKCMKSLEGTPLFKIIRMRDVKLAYTFSQMASVKDPELLGIQSDFVEFLEGIARLADMTFGRGLPDAMKQPLSDKLRKFIPALVAANGHIVSKFTKRMVKSTKEKVKHMERGSADWQREERSQMMDKLMNWKVRANTTEEKAAEEGGESVAK